MVEERYVYGGTLPQWSWLRRRMGRFATGGERMQSDFGSEKTIDSTISKRIQTPAIAGTYQYSVNLGR